MIDYRKVSALAKDAARARRLAQFLLKTTEQEWTDWELDFLAAMTSREEALTTRQAEKLVELEEAATWLDAVPGLGFSVRLLVKGCHEARAELDEEDAAFVTALRAQGATKVRRRSLWRLMRIAREAGVVESEPKAA
ncbi:MAG: hypothetical protein NW223_14290 [Hyphomicrobiaceae bacterium]|nr:hypothetical protein [Hyphomicrobiaceae bacterium]